MLGIVLTKNDMFLIIINENMSSKQEVTRGRGVTTERAPGSGSMLRVMTRQKIRQLYKDVNHSDKLNYSSAGRKSKDLRKKSVRNIAKMRKL